MLLFWILLLALLVGVIWRFSQPSTYYTEGPVRSRGKYIVLNKITGNLCYDGRLFRSYKAANKVLNNLSDILGNEWFEVRKVV